MVQYFNKTIFFLILMIPSIVFSSASAEAGSQSKDSNIPGWIEFGTDEWPGVRDALMLCSKINGFDTKLDHNNEIVSTSIERLSMSEREEEQNKLVTAITNINTMLTASYSRNIFTHVLLIGREAGGLYISSRLARNV